MVKFKKKKKIEQGEDEDYEGMDEDDLEKGEIEAPKRVKKVKRRYMAVEQPKRTGVVDTETGESIAEGEHANLELLANIIERLERIEAMIGSIIEE